MGRERTPIALVIGLCSHGIAMVRALRGHGVDIHAFEKNRHIPGAKTNVAKVHIVSDINSEKLIAELLKFRETIDADRDIILLPTNDNNVRILGENVASLKGKFLLSWIDCAEQVCSLLLKDNIEMRCSETGLNYPKSRVINELDEIATIASNFDFPVLIKPVKPQSGFKALKIDDLEGLQATIGTFSDDLPILVQDWISGTDKDLYFSALYLNDGEVVSSFVGNKLESYPPAMGQTTVAINIEQSEVESITKQFFEGLKLSGPVSLELKCDDNGKFWVIEPTVGRTDFWAGLCTKSGWNIVLAEYQHGCQHKITSFAEPRPTIWFDSERDIAAFPRNISYLLGGSSKPKYAPAFSFLDSKDIRPFILSCRYKAGKILQSIGHKIRGEKASLLDPSLSIECFDEFSDVPQSFIDIMTDSEQSSIFNGADWYKNFYDNVAKVDGEVIFYCLYKNSEAAAILPIWYKLDKDAKVFKVKHATTMSNYYSPIFELSFVKEHVSLNEAYQVLISQIVSGSYAWDYLDIFPTNDIHKAALMEVCDSLKLSAFPYLLTQNYFQEDIVSYDDYLAQRPSILRNTIKRKTKKLDKSVDWNIKIFQQQDDITEALEKYHDVYKSSWKIAEPYPNFINGLVELSHRRGWLRLGLLTIDGEVIAAQLWLVFGNTAYIYKLAYIKSFRNYSPGTILTNALVRHVIETDKVSKIDFLTGADSFKLDWMTVYRELLGVQIVNKGRPVGLLSYVRNTIGLLRKKIGEKSDVYKVNAAQQNKL